VKATECIPHIDYSHPISARKVRSGFLTREKFHIQSSQPSSKSPDSAIGARVVRTGYHTDDVFAMGDYSILAHNPAVLAP
jgi:hypothetical protein